jgi:methionyl-tRNA formyltransferase
MAENQRQAGMNTQSNERTVFMGSPDFAMPTLRALAEALPVVGVITQPDKPAGRGRVLTPPPIKLLAQSLGIPVIQPERLREPTAMEKLHSWAPELIVVAAFGQILRPAVLDLPRYGCLNVHASLLPRWRGAAPIQAAILAGDEQTGVTIMRMDAGIDTGPTLSQRSLPILPEDTAATLSEHLATLGAQLLLDVLPSYLQGDLVALPQPETGATYAPMLQKSEGQLDFTQPATNLARRVRAFNPWPGAFTFWNEQLLKIHQAHAVAVSASSSGQLLIHDGLPAIGTSDGLLVLDTVQPAGKKSMPGAVFLQGARGWGV